MLRHVTYICMADLLYTYIYLNWSRGKNLNFFKLIYETIFFLFLFRKMYTSNIYVFNEYCLLLIDRYICLHSTQIGIDTYSLVLKGIWFGLVWFGYIECNLVCGNSHLWIMVVWSKWYNFANQKKATKYLMHISNVTNWRQLGIVSLLKDKKKKTKTKMRCTNAKLPQITHTHTDTQCNTSMYSIWRCIFMHSKTENKMKSETVRNFTSIRNRQYHTWKRNQWAK